MIIDEKDRILAFRSLKQGDFVRAKILLEKLLNQGDRSVQNSYNLAKEELLRRYWRQGKVDELQTEAGDSSSLVLAIARLSGKESLQEMANSSHKDAFLAKLSLEPSLKTALLQMRQMPGWKEMAEGWLSLLKRDLVKARESFTLAIAYHSQRAEIALFIVDALEGNISNQELLKLPVLRFPGVSRLLERKKRVSSLLCFGSFEELEKILCSLTSSQKEEKGRIYMRLGDLEYVKKNERSKAVFYWHKAEGSYPALRLDRLKREFISFYRQDDWKDCEKLFSEYFHALYRKDKKLSGSFLKELLRSTSSEFYATLPTPLFSENQQKWLTSEVPPEVLLFMGAKKCAVMNGVLVLKIISNEECKDSELTFFFNEFLKAESYFFEDEFYFTVKSQFAFIARDYKERRKALARLIEIQPFLLQEKMPEYVQMALLTKDDTFALKEEIKRFSFLFPSHFDLARLQFLVGEEIPGYIDQFSLPLRSVLALQMSLDKNEKKAATDFEDFLTLQGKDQEADWRFWHALFAQEESSISFTKIKQAFDETVLKPKLQEEIFSQVMKYQEMGLSKKLLEHWMKKDFKAWHPYFCSALDQIRCLDDVTGLRLLKRALVNLPKECGMYDRIKMLLGIFDLMGCL